MKTIDLLIDVVPFDAVIVILNISLPLASYIQLITPVDELIVIHVGNHVILYVITRPIGSITHQAFKIIDGPHQRAGFPT